MSSNIVNLGDQVHVFDYRQEARGKGFNRAFCDTFSYGLYSGGRLTRVSDTMINVGLLVCIIKSDEDDKVALRIETTESQDISLAESIGSAYVDPNKPYIVLRFGWHDVEINYMDIRAVGWSTSPDETDPDKLHSFDLILGKVIFQEVSGGSGEFIIASENSFDISRRHDVFVKDSESVAGQFRVSSSESDSKKVFISGGKVNTSKGRFLLAGAEFPPDGFPDTEAMGRTDLIVINAEGEFRFIQGSPSATIPALAPKYQNYKVLAEIRRGPNRSNVLGTDIVQITDATIRGPVATDDFPLEDSENILPKKDRNIESAINYILHRSIAISPQDSATLGVVCRRNVKWGIIDPDEIYAGSIPIRNSGKLFKSTNIEDVLNEIAGAGRTTESLKGLADIISPLGAAIIVLKAFRQWSDSFQYIADDPAIFNGGIYFANPVDVPDVGEDPVKYPNKWIAIGGGGTGGGFTSRSTIFLQAATNIVTIPPHLNKGFFWAVFVNQLECEPDIDYTVDGRVITFNQDYPQGTRITFHYVFQAETTTSFEDAWFELRYSNPRHYLYGVNFEVRPDSGSLKFISAGFSINGESDIHKFISGKFDLLGVDAAARFINAGFTLNPETTARFFNADFSADETKKVKLSEVEFSLRT
jgi:hypothetical protein